MRGCSRFCRPIGRLFFVCFSDSPPTELNIGVVAFAVTRGCRRVPVKVSDFQEYVLFVEEIEEEPGDGKISYAQQQGAGCSRKKT